MPVSNFCSNSGGNVLGVREIVRAGECLGNVSEGGNVLHSSQQGTARGTNTEIPLVPFRLSPFPH